MLSRTLVVAGTAAALPFTLVVALAVQSGTTARAANDPATVVGTGPSGGGLKPGSVPSSIAPWIEKAAGACPGLPAPVLAAQLNQESSFNPNAVSRIGAQGIAQFLPATWPAYGVDANHNGVNSPFDPPDAITAQGRFMCDLLHQAQHSGINDQPIKLALAGYNAGWDKVVMYHGVPPASFGGGEAFNYANSIMASAAHYTAPAGPSGAVDLPAGFSLPASTPAPVRTAVAWALEQRGGWYHLGGSCTNAHGSDPAGWCDCSSLMQQAYRAAGIALSRTTFTQVNEGQGVAIDAPLPGDLVFSPGSDGTAGSPGHVGMFIGGGLLIEAPHTGVQTRVVTYASWRNSDSAEERIVAVRRIVPQ